MTNDHKDKIKEGEDLFQKGDMNQAEIVFKSILQDYPGDYVSFNNLGVINNTKGNTVLAEEYFRKSISLNGDYLEPIINLACLYQSSKLWSETAALLELSLEIDANNSDIYNQLGIVYLEMNEPAKACSALEGSLKLNPDQPAVNESLDAVRKEISVFGTTTQHTLLNILFVQNFPCIRNYKMVTALKSKGHKVTLAYTKYRISQIYEGLEDSVYDDCIKIRDNRHLWDISGDFDIIHSHNEPDELTVVALACDTPVVHDTHDLISLKYEGNKDISFFEGIANRGAAGRVYTTPYQMEEARSLYGMTGPSIVYYNYASRADLPKRILPKLSDKDGDIHIVYEGGIAGIDGKHRDFTSPFFDLANKGIHIHIYPPSSCDKEIAKQYSSHNNIHFHNSISPRQIMEIMTQYDYGIIPFNLAKGNNSFLDTTIANKLFEYLAAGLPVIASPLKSYIDYFQNNPVGIIYNTAQDIIDSMPRLKEITSNTDFTKYTFTYEGEIERLEEFYYRILDKNVPEVKPTTHETINEPERQYRSKPISEIMSIINTSVSTKENTATLIPTKDETESLEQEKYQQMYNAGYSHHSNLKKDIVQFISRYLNEFHTAIDIGCGTGKYAHYLQEKQKKMVLGVDIVNEIKFPNIRFKNQFAWNLDTKVDLIYAIDLMEHIPMHMISSSIEAISKHCKIFIADVSTIVDKLGDKIGKRLHVTVRPVQWWIERFAETFNEVKILKTASDGFFVECRNDLSPVFDKSRMSLFKDWATTLQTTSTQYRDVWNRHAKSLPWKGKVLYIGSNDLCRKYYNEQFFNVEKVIHVDPDPKSNPDIVAYAENMSVLADNSADGIAFFGTPYVVNDPKKMIAETHRILKPGGILSGSFNSSKSPWTGKLYINGEVKSSEEYWHFDKKIIELFNKGWSIFYWGCQNDEYYHLSAIKR